MTEAAPTGALGFDPAPGSPAAVLALAAKLRTSAASLGEASRVVDALVSRSGAWEGEAATAFRTALSDDLPRYLRSAHDSLADAARRLTSWHDTLVSHRTLAARYASLAAAATTPEALANARRLARELAAQHATDARRVADALDSATDRLAPKEPGVLESLWREVIEDPADSLSNLSAVLGLLSAGLAFVCPPAALAVMLVGSGLSLAALTMHASDPKFRKPLKDGFTKGEFDADFWKSSVTLMGDTLGTVPGVAAVATGAKAGVGATRAAMAVPETSALSGLGAGAGTFARTTWSTGNTIRTTESPLSQWALRNAAPGVRDTASVAVPATGAFTAGMGYTPWAGDTTEQTGTAVDGTRGVLEDAPAAAAKFSHAWSAMRVR
ncbi:hypothetical protein [Streptomyces sp. NPDC051211]|uniref:hypothetical protein n=1 Tax=Streptomyces sp. NPDC051211 TaxID=3154643 RepID=UPI00344FCA13